MGVDIDLRTNTASIPAPKVAKVLSYLTAVTAVPSPKKLELRFLEEMLGLLNWISSL
jgi:hypothetical protein